MHSQVSEMRDVGWGCQPGKHCNSRHYDKECVWVCGCFCGVGVENTEQEIEGKYLNQTGNSNSMPCLPSSVMLLLLMPTPTPLSPPCQECHHPPLSAVLQGRNCHKAAEHLAKTHGIIQLSWKRSRQTPPPPAAHILRMHVCVLCSGSVQTHGLCRRRCQNGGFYFFVLTNAPSVAVCWCKTCTLLLKQINTRTL